MRLNLIVNLAKAASFLFIILLVWIIVDSTANLKWMSDSASNVTAATEFENAFAVSARFTVGVAIMNLLWQISQPVSLRQETKKGRNSVFHSFYGVLTNGKRPGMPYIGISHSGC
ncbi:MAG TPA: hypothetical protein VFL47_01080 [Flavisolibacter sp.]|nr:hypothetical protein [Flavisolibacter sp.]